MNRQRFIPAGVLASIKKDMKHIICILVLLLLISKSFSQIIEDDILNSKSKWGMKLEVGGLLHHMPNQTQVDAKLSLAGSFSIFYNNLFLRNEIYTIEFSPKNMIVFGKYIFFDDTEFISINLNPEIGYCFNISNKWSSDIRLGLNITNFDLKYTEELGSYSSDFVTGVVLGLTMDRYIKFNGLKYLVLGLNIDYYSTNYNSISPDLDRSAINFSLTAAYKFRFNKK